MRLRSQRQHRSCDRRTSADNNEPSEHLQQRPTFFDHTGSRRLTDLQARQAFILRSALMSKASKRNAIARANRGIARLCEDFPAAFVAERWQEHRPLKVGVHVDINTLETLSPKETLATIRAYTSRPQYLKSLTPGAARVDLFGDPAGEVTQNGADFAAQKMAAIEALAIRRVEAAKAARQAMEAPCHPNRTARDARRPRKVWPVFPDGRDGAKHGKRDDPEATVQAPAPDITVAPASPVMKSTKRLGLSDLKRAAQERRAAMA
jgi:sRNA-binding protein